MENFGLYDDGADYNPESMKQSSQATPSPQRSQPEKKSKGDKTIDLSRLD